MEEFAIDLDKVLDEFEETEGIAFFSKISPPVSVLVMLLTIACTTIDVTCHAVLLQSLRFLC